MKACSRVTPIIAALLAAALFVPATASYAADATEEPTAGIVDSGNRDDGDTALETENDGLHTTADSGEFAEQPESFGAPDASSDDGSTGEPAIPSSPKPFTPGGQATVVDWATEYDGKEFYTFRTPAGNVFHLVIDHARGADNVYFLGAVTEQALLALAEQAGKNGGTSSIPTTGPPSEPPEAKPVETEPKPGAAEDDRPPEKGGGAGLVIFALMGVLAAGGVIYYLKIVRPKKRANNDYEDEDTPDEGSDREMEFEDEPGESGDEDTAEDGGE